MTPNDWLAVVRHEYMDDFVAQGGAAVKVCVCVDARTRTALQSELQHQAEAGGYVRATASAVSTRLHQIEKLFNEVARQINWDALTHSFLVSLLRGQGVRLPEAGQPFTLTTIADLNGFAEPFLRNDVQRWLRKEILEDYAMGQEFRFAMAQLCLAHLDPTDDPALESSLKAWLRGELRLLSAIKRAQIFQKIARHNARYMLASLAHWVTRAGRRGLVLELDISRYAETVKPSDRNDGLYYSTPAALDVYEVLRQFIDATDDMECCFIVVITGQEFLHDDRRGLRGYQALYMRLADEVRDRYRQNPLASLVRLESVESGHGAAQDGYVEAERTGTAATSKRV